MLNTKLVSQDTSPYAMFYNAMTTSGLDWARTDKEIAAQLQKQVGRQVSVRTVREVRQALDTFIESLVKILRVPVAKGATATN